MMCRFVCYFIFRTLQFGSLLAGSAFIGHRHLINRLNVKTVMISVNHVPPRTSAWTVSSELLGF